LVGITGPDALVGTNGRSFHEMTSDIHKADGLQPFDMPSMKPGKLDPKFAHELAVGSMKVNGAAMVGSWVERTCPPPAAG
jgi:hypothetical protein